MITTGAPDPGRRWLLPLLVQLRGYRPTWLRDDILAGLSIAAVALPTAIAYPVIVGLPPETGLYAATVPSVAYALFGPTRRLMVGPDSATCLVLASALLYLNVADDQRVMTAAALAVLTGLMCLVARAFRLGFLGDFFSRPVLIGFLAGIAVDLIIGQLGRLTGIAIASKGLLRPMIELASKVGQTHLPTLCLGLGLFVLLRFLRRLAPTWPGPLIAVAIGLLLGVGFDLPDHGVRSVGAISGGLPTFSMPLPNGVALDDLLLAAFSILLVSFGSGIITARSFGARDRVDVDSNRELTGFGAANIASGLFGGFPVTSSDSRTAVNHMMGGRTQVAGLVAAAALLCAVAFAGRGFAYLPLAALGAVLASAALDLIDLPRLAALWRIDRIEFSIAMTTLLGVVVFGVLRGVALAVTASLLHLLWLGTRPHDALLGRIPGRTGLYKLHHYAEAVPIPGVAIYLPQGSWVFYNADYVKERMLKLAGASLQSGQTLILDASAITHMDSSAVERLELVEATLRREGITFVIAGLHGQPRAILERSGLSDRIGRDRLKHSVEEAAAAFEQRGETGAGAAMPPRRTGDWPRQLTNY